MFGLGRRWSQPVLVWRQAWRQVMTWWLKNIENSVAARLIRLRARSSLTESAVARAREEIERAQQELRYPRWVLAENAAIREATAITVIGEVVRVDTQYGGHFTYATNEPEPDDDEPEDQPDPDERAWDLLVDNLTSAQKRTLTRHGNIHVKGSVTGWRYRIRGDMTSDCQFNIERLDKRGKAEKSICFKPHGDEDYDLPTGDIMLAQKIIIETDELAMFKVANVEDA